MRFRFTWNNDKFPYLSKTCNQLSLYAGNAKRSVHCNLVNQRHKALPKQISLLQGFCCSKDPPSYLYNPMDGCHQGCANGSQGFYSKKKQPRFPKGKRFIPWWLSILVSSKQRLTTCWDGTVLSPKLKMVK